METQQVAKRLAASYNENTGLLVMKEGESVVYDKKIGFNDEWDAITLQNGVVYDINLWRGDLNLRILSIYSLTIDEKGRECTNTSDFARVKLTITR